MIVLHVTSSDVLINISCGFASSFLFIHLVLFLYKPRIKIAPFIAHNIDDFDLIGQPYYSFKMLNVSSFKAFDVSVQLYEVITLPSENGKTHNRYKELTLKTNKFTYISRRKWRILHPTYSDNALVFRTYENISAILKDDIKKIIIEVTLKHGLTGITNIITQQFVYQGCVKEGKFKAGNKFDIIT